MNYKTLLFLCAVILFVFPHTGKAATQTLQEKRNQQIEILQQEIAVLQALVANMQPRNEISASSYVAINLSHNTTALEKNVSQIYPIASLTKLMTAVIAIEQLDKHQSIVLTKEMLKPKGQSTTLYEGLAVDVPILLKAMLIQSSNDAAQALSYFLGKDVFLQKMNKKAAELGMIRTIFYDVHGLNSANQSTAEDMAKLLNYTYKNHPEILATTRNNNFWLPDSTGILRKFQNLNNFYYFSSFVGGKTGYLVESKQTFAGIFEVNGTPFAIIILHSPNHQADVFSILGNLE